MAIGNSAWCALMAARLHGRARLLEISDAVIGGFVAWVGTWLEMDATPPVILEQELTVGMAMRVDAQTAVWVQIEENTRAGQKTVPIPAARESALSFTFPYVFLE